MSRRKRTEITVETDEILVIRRTTTAAAVRWCSHCCRTVAMMTPDEAAALLSVSPRVIYRMIEANLIRHDETAGGLVLICPASITELPLRTDL